MPEVYTFFYTVHLYGQAWTQGSQTMCGFGSRRITYAPPSPFGAGEWEWTPRFARLMGSHGSLAPPDPYGNTAVSRMILKCSH